MKVIIVGGGSVGSHIAGQLLQSGCDVSVIETRESVLKKLEKEIPKECIVVGNGSDPSIMEEAGISGTDVVVAATGQDEVNLVVSTIAKYEFGVPRVIARVSNPKNEWLYDAGMGVDVKFNQANILAQVVINEIDMKNVIKLLQLNRGDYSIVQLSVDKGSISDGKLIGDLPIPTGVVLIGIQRGEDVVLPRGNVDIQAGDQILAMVNELGLIEINKLFRI